MKEPQVNSLSFVRTGHVYEIQGLLGIRTTVDRIADHFANKAFSGASARRTRCFLCWKPWAELSGNVCAVATNHGNVLTCGHCYQSLEASLEGSDLPDASSPVCDWPRQAQINWLADRGIKDADIARFFGLSRERIRQLRSVDLNALSHSQRQSDILQALRDGYTRTEVVANLKTSHAHISACLRDAGIKYADFAEARHKRKVRAIADLLIDLLLSKKIDAIHYSIRHKYRDLVVRMGNLMPIQDWRTVVMKRLEERGIRGLAVENLAGGFIPEDTPSAGAAVPAETIGDSA